MDETDDRAVPAGAATSPTETLGALERGTTTTAAALAFYDALPPVSPDAVVGTWRGSGLATGHPLDGVLEALGWYGKRFGDVDGDAHPLLFDDGRGGVVDVNPVLAPLGVVLRCAPLVRRRVVASLVRAVLPVARTRRPRARVRATAYRGVVSATMAYDAQPIDDHLRAVDDDTLLGPHGRTRYAAPVLLRAAQAHTVRDTASPGRLLVRSDLETSPWR